MSEFEKELDGILEIIKDEKFYNSKLYALPSIEELKAHFKDWQPPKKIVEVPQFVADYIELCIRGGSGLIWSIRPDRDANELCRLTYDWLFPNGYRLEDGSFPDPFEPDNLVRPDSNNQLKFARAWLDGYAVEKEQLYEIRLPMPKGNYASIDSKGYIWGELIPNKYKLTESEIKAIDERYWAFAVKVDEVEPRKTHKLS